MLTVGSVASEMGLELVSGADAADRPIRWVHITELTDPTPWLSGGELILTTGMRLRGADAQRAFVRRLADHQLAGLGFGTGFDHATLPDALVEEAGAVGFPVFEVPYELPFIAITELAFTRLVNEHYETLQRGIELHKRLERIVLEERGRTPCSSTSRSTRAAASRRRGRRPTPTRPTRSTGSSTTA
jgi:purine catabolism regulator